VRGREDESQRIERGLYVCEECDAAFNADVNVKVNRAENIRLDITEQNNSESVPDSGGERSPGSAGWHSQESTCTSCPGDSNCRIKW
jgi:transposase